MATSVTINVHPDPAGFEVREYPDCGSGPFVAVELGGGVSVVIADLDVMAGLVHLVRVAEQQLADLDANADHPDTEPVGDTGLTLHPLPVGVA